MSTKRHIVMSLILGIAILLPIVGCRANPEGNTGFDWPRWRGPNGDGISLETGWNPKALEGGPHVLWERNIGMGYSNISIMGNRLFATGCTGRYNVVSCLSADTGSILWQYSHESAQDPQATPTVDGVSVYVLTKDGILLCLNQKNGRLRWRRDLVAEHGALKPYYGFAGSPVVEGDLVVVNANASGMAFHKMTGRLVWGSEKPPEGLAAELGDDNGTTYMTPVVYSTSGERYALIYSWKGLSSVNIKTGEPLWQYPWPSYNLNKAPDPVLINNMILIADDNEGDYYKRFSTLLGIENGEPTILWQSSALYSDVSSPVVIDGYIYGSYGGTYSISRFSSLRCLDLEGGRLMWEHPNENRRKQWISLTAADGKIVVLEEAGKLSIIEASPAAYTEISSCELPKGEKKSMRFYTPPVLCNGRLYCRNYSGDMICIDVSK